MKQRIIISVALFLMASFAIVAQEYARDMVIHTSEGNYVYELPYQADGFRVIDFEYSSQPSGTENGYPYVDMGLPSGKKWALYNIGANHPLQYGNHYAWGELVPAAGNVYNWTNYKYCNDAEGNSFSKYCNDENYGTVDNLVQLDLIDDVAKATWGGEWCVPSYDDFMELGDHCDFIRGFVNGVYGISVISRINGATLFAPAGGFYIDQYYYHPSNEQLKDNNLPYVGAYWSSTLCENKMQCASMGYFDNNYVGMKEDGDNLVFIEPYRYLGMSVRPVISTDKLDGYEYVDLGLPSGKMWATSNLGASSPYEYGNYYTMAPRYESDDYKYPEDDPTIYHDGTPGDIANKAMGGRWRIPTNVEYDELANNCDFYLGYVNGVYGLTIVSKKNKKSMFAPAAGAYLGGNYINDDPGVGAYWSSTPCSATTLSLSNDLDLGSSGSDLSVTESETSTTVMSYIGMFNQKTIDLETLPSVIGVSIRPIWCPEINVKPSGTENGHEYVDLGLPSGLKWAVSNLTYNGSEYFAFAKEEDKEYAENDPVNYVDSSVDPAANILGGTWRMPTVLDFQEVQENCTFSKEFVDGKYGVVITGPNGNSMFVPMTDIFYLGASEASEFGDAPGFYWSSTPYEEEGVSDIMRWVFAYNENTYMLENALKISKGIAIRPVCTKVDNK